jgi:hypothetical protein
VYALRVRLGQFPQGAGRTAAAEPLGGDEATNEAVDPLTGEVVSLRDGEDPVRRRVPLGMIALDEVLQPRRRIDERIVQRYVAALEDGQELPPLTVVFDGMATWLADGFHRCMAYREAGRIDAECIVHFGSKDDALRLSVGANANHGQPRTAEDLKRAYDLAVVHKLVDPLKVEEVRALLRCTRHEAEDLTREARQQADAVRLHRIVELRSKGWGWLRIGKVVGLSDRAVGNIIAGLPCDPKDGPRTSPDSGELREPAEEAAGTPETPTVAEPQTSELAVPEEERDLTAGEPDLLEATVAAEGTPLEDYIKQQKETREQRMMWFEALEALERFAKLPTPQQLFENRDQSFDHLIGQALDVADACTDRWARELTKDVRDAREAELRQKMHELKEQGFSQREIAAALEVDRQVVRTYLDSLKPAKKAAGLERNSFEETHPEAEPEPNAGDEIIEQVDAWDRPINQDDDHGNPPKHDEGPAEPVYSTGADGLPQAEMFADATPGAAEPEPEPEDEAEPTAEHDPLAVYNEQWKAETPQREMWGKALTVLQEFAHLPEPEVLFANRYTRFDYLFKPAVDNAFNWLEAFEEKWHGPQDR